MDSKSQEVPILEMLRVQTPLCSSQLTTETRSAAIAAVLTWFNQLSHPHISARVWLECQTALVEGFTNVLQHAHANLPTETPILSKIYIYEQAVEMQVWDQGAAFDLATLLQKPPEQVAMTSEHGRGLLIIRNVTDYLAYTRRLDDRNCLLMIKLL